MHHTAIGDYVTAMKILRASVYIACMMLLPMHGNAQLKLAQDEVIFDCQKLPVLAVPPTLPEDVSFNHTNNLRRATGSPFIAEGEKIRIIGKVVDENCIPLADTKVIMWQNDSKGNLPFVTDQTEEQAAKRDPYFQYSGQMVTNNAGDFSFLSVLPKSASDVEAPHVFFRAEHPELGAVMTRMYFPEYEENQKDPVFSVLSGANQQTITAKRLYRPFDQMTEDAAEDESLYIFYITMKGTQQMKRY